MTRHSTIQDIKLACYLEGIFDALRIASDHDDIMSGDNTTNSIFYKSLHHSQGLWLCIRPPKFKTAELNPQLDLDASHINNPNSWKTLRRKLAVPR